MKKLIAILAVFAVVAGAAFAKGAVDPDGTWGDVNISTKGAFGSVVDIDGVSTSLAVDGDGNEWVSEWTGYSLGLSYSWNVLTVGVDFDKGGYGHYLQVGNDDISLKISGDYDGDVILAPKYTGFAIEASHEEEWGSVDFHYEGSFGTTPTTDTLWGSFSIYDSLFFKGSWAGGGGEDRWLIAGDLVIDNGNVTGGDEDKYFLFNYDLGGVLEGLEAGLFVPELFVDTVNTEGNPFLKTVYGVKYDGDPVKLAFQFYGLDDTEFKTGIRFQAELLSLVGFDVIIEDSDMKLLGAKITSPEIDLGAAKLNASAKFYSEDEFDTFHLDADVGLGFNAEPLGAQVDFEFRGYFGDTVHADGYVASLAIKPSVWYDIDTHLQAKVSAEFNIPFADGASIGWSLNPVLVYNFFGGGFDFGGVSTGMFLGYEVGGELGDDGGIKTNEVTLGMKWSF